MEMWSSGSDKVVLTWIDVDVGHFSEIMFFSREHFTLSPKKRAFDWFVLKLVPTCEARRVLSGCLPNVLIKKKDKQNKNLCFHLEKQCTCDARSLHHSHYSRRLIRGGPRGQLVCTRRCYTQVIGSYKTSPVCVCQVGRRVPTTGCSRPLWNGCCSSATLCPGLRSQWGVPRTL